MQPGGRLLALPSGRPSCRQFPAAARWRPVTCRVTQGRQGWPSLMAVLKAEEMGLDQIFYKIPF